MSLGFFIAILASVAVYCEGKEVGRARGLQVLKQLDLLTDKRHASTRLQERSAFNLGFSHSLSESSRLFFLSEVLQGSFANFLPGRPA